MSDENFRRKIEEALDAMFFYGDKNVVFEFEEKHVCISFLGERVPVIKEINPFFLKNIFLKVAQVLYGETSSYKVYSMQVKAYISVSRLEIKDIINLKN